MSRPNKDTRAKRAFKKAWKYFGLLLLILVLLIAGLFFISMFDLPFGINVNRIDLTWLLLFGLAYIFAYFKDYLDEINEKLDRLELKMNDK